MKAEKIIRFQNFIMEPLGKMNAYFPVINDQISKRNKKV